MSINSEEQAIETLRQWSEKSPRIQLGLLREAIEGLELNQMYYEQKGNDKGAARTEAILALLRRRLDELTQGIPGA